MTTEKNKADAVPTQRKTNSVAPAETPPLTRIVSADYVGPKTITNVDLGDPIGAKILLGSQGEPDLVPDAIGDGIVEIAYWLVKQVVRTDEQTGEVKISARTTLIGPDGVSFGCESSGVIESLDLIRQVYGDGPYDPPIRCKLASSKTRHGGRYYYLIAAD